MDIVAVNPNFTRPGEVALRTEPPMTIEVFSKVIELTKDNSIFAGFKFSFEDHSLIVIRSEPFPMEFADGLANIIEEANDSVDRLKRSDQQKADAERTAKEASVKAASVFFGVPIK